MNEQQQKVDKLIARVEDHQKALGLSDSRFVLRYQEFLRSTDSWRRRLCARNWAELGKQLPKWEETLNRLVALLDGGQEIGRYYDSLPIARYAESLYDMLDGQRTDRRVAFLIGPTGVGKSWVMKWLAMQNPRAAVYCYANECWADSMSQIAGGIALAVGAPVDKYSGKRTFANVTTLLRSHPMTVCLDDWQKAGVLGLKLVKSLIDDTRAKIILGVYPTSWAQLTRGSTDAMAESQQILGRTIRPINRTWLEGLTKEDCAAYMRAAGIRGDVALTAERMAKGLQANGNLRVLADAVSLAQLNADEQDAECTAAMVQSAFDVLCPVEKR